MPYQLRYPPDAVFRGCSVQTYRDVLGRLIGWALQARDRGEEETRQSERSLVAALAASLAIDPAVAGRVVAGFTLNRENAAYHATVPGIAAAPLIRTDENGLVSSIRGLTTEPLLFLARELRRVNAREYHNNAHLQEGVFRQDLYDLFGEKRFVTSAASIKLRRDKGDLRTDIDAIVFEMRRFAFCEVGGMVPVSQWSKMRRVSAWWD